MKTIIAILLILTSYSLTDVVLPSIISDHMILQSGAEISIWGTADKGEQVTVEFAGQSQTTTTTDAKGNWKIKLSPLKASSKAQNLTVTGKNKIIV